MPTFLHAADLHIDSPLRGLENTLSPEAATRIRGASRKALVKLVDLAISRTVTFVVLAGDVLDGGAALESAMFLGRELERLRVAGIPVFVALGNHDYAGLVPGHFADLPGVHTFSRERAETKEIEGVALHGRSYAVRDVVENLSLTYPDPVAGKLNIGVLHTLLEGATGHLKYAPTTPAILANRGYAYWALGHVHARSESDVNGVRIVFPGNLQGRHANETGPKGCFLVDYRGTAITGTTFVACDDVRWHRVTVAAQSDAAATQEAIHAAVEDATRESRELRLACPVRVVVTGTHPDAAQWRGAAPEWRENIVARLQDPSIWVEKLKMEVVESTQGPPAQALEARTLLEQATEELDANTAEIAAVFEKLLKQVRDVGDASWIEEEVVKVVPRSGDPVVAREALKSGMDLLAASLSA